MLRRAVHSAGLNTSHILIHIFMYYIMTTLYTYVFTFSADPSGMELQWCLLGLSGKCIGTCVGTPVQHEVKMQMRLVR